MKLIEPIKYKDSTPKTFYDFDFFIIEGIINWDNSITSKIISIDFTISNKDPTSFFYEISEINYCKKIISGAVINVIEFHFIRSSTPPSTPVPYTVNNINLILGKNIFLFNNILIYNKASNILKCHYIDIDPQPKTKNGAIIVGI